jgi:hypothetical protein
MVGLANQPPEVDETLARVALTQLADELRGAVDEGLITADDCDLALAALERTRQARDLGWRSTTTIPMPSM